MCVCVCVCVCVRVCVRVCVLRVCRFVVCGKPGLRLTLPQAGRFEAQREKAYLARCYLRALAGGCACPRIPDARNLRAVLVCQGWKQALPGEGGCVLVREGSVYGG